MTESHRHPLGSLSQSTLVVMMLLVGGLTLLALQGFAWQAALGTIYGAVSEVGLVLLIVAAAGGGAYPLVRRLAPRSSSTGLQVVTACGLGLWGLSTAVLVLGTAGVTTRWLWWPVVLGGTAFAAWQARRRVNAWRPGGRSDGRALLWVLVAVAGALWIAGATRAPGRIGGADAYDVLEYHLQVPREFLHAGRIGELPHNCYSYYPLGVEMLFLLAMSLRGGAYEGMYAAKLVPGVFGALTAAAVFFALRPQQERRARFALGLLVSVPLVLWLSWLAMVELAEVFYLALAVLWLREWTGGGDWRAALLVGLACGAACAAKYLSVGFVVAPVVAAMVLAPLLRRKPLPGVTRRLLHVPLVLAAVLATFSPWLIRNAAYTGNPVFPLATGVFGRGHWNEQSERRWVDGHAPNPRPPVPKPEGWAPPDYTPGRAELLYDRLIVKARFFGAILLILAGVAVAVRVADRGPGDPWDLGLIIVALVQLIVWTGLTRGMPHRFVVPILVPLALLGGGVLARLANVQVNPFRRGATRPAGGPWGLAPAVAVFAAAAGISLYNATALFPVHPELPYPGQTVAKQMFPYSEAPKLPPGSRLLLVGEATAFYFPHDTLYATAFDAHPLAELARQVADGRITLQEAWRRLRERGVTHVWVNWGEIRRLALTYGYPTPLSEQVVGQTGRLLRPAHIPILTAMAREGFVLPGAKDIHLPTDEPGATTRPGAWPPITVYALATEPPAEARAPGEATAD